MLDPRSYVSFNSTSVPFNQLLPVSPLNCQPLAANILLSGSTPLASALDFCIVQSLVAKTQMLFTEFLNTSISGHSHGVRTPIVTLGLGTH